MERIAIDSIGELEADELGNKHIIVIIDTFTRFVEMYPVYWVLALEPQYPLPHLNEWLTGDIRHLPQAN